MAAELEVCLVQKLWYRPRLNALKPVLVAVNQLLIEVIRQITALEHRCEDRIHIVPISGLTAVPLVVEPNIEVVAELSHLPEYLVR